MTPDEYGDGDIGPALRLLCIALLVVVLGIGACDCARARFGTGTGSRCSDDLECPTGWTCERGRCERPAPRLACVASMGGPL